MVALILDSLAEDQLIRERQARGADRYDEVWDGVYVMSPIANNEHQWLASRLTTVIGNVIETQGRGRVFAATNVSDQDTHWVRNYRVPDVAVFLNGNPAEDRDTHWFGGPDFAIEIVSPGDRSREKFEFYAATGTRELLILDRAPWSLELYRLEGETLQLVGASTPGEETILTSGTIPFTFRLIAGDERPPLEIVHTESGQRSII